MLTREQFLHAQARAHEYLDRAEIVLTPEESKNIEVAGFGLGELEVTGLELFLSFQRAAATSPTSSPTSRSAAPQSSRNDKSRVGAGVVWTRRGDAPAPTRLTGALPKKPTPESTTCS